ncbi:DNA polymerase III subunit gamma/tau [Terriglobus aquaticus]|uniref:DNA polymerase III subunit gamma/tau n=1 Tax=Terriglobus aquaticus TaxID=940139 RepID=A0ABW9KJW5_9BACT|nr:DNA polymerase III subunit gamma/tau [Terriglobus aquaticus]
MPYQVLARKYRPLRFGDVVGQDHVTRTLQNALEQGRVAHGYIFSGHRGIGKTTIARILASALNCQRTIGSPERPTPEPCLTCDSCREIRQGNAVDVIEIDAATNRGIDEIRELRDAARYRPARDRFKIYILDEAHQITDAAFNALLKTLEEPPEHIVFMMATTEPENIPQTIRSRCQHFSFHAVKLDDILGQLRKIAVDENVLADDAALDLLAEAGDGSMRDALSIMDQAIASAPVVQEGGIAKPQLSAAEIRDLMGSVPNTVFEEILEHVSANSASGVLTTANRLLDAGNSPAQIARQFVRYLRNTVVAKIANLTPDSPDTELLQISPDERRRAARSAMLFTEEELTRFMQVMLRTFDDLGFRQEQRFHLELGLLKLVHLQRLLPMEHFLSQLPRPDTTRRIATPTPAPRPATPTPSSRTADAGKPQSSSPAQTTQAEAANSPVQDQTESGPHVLQGRASGQNQPAPATAPSPEAPTRPSPISATVASSAPTPTVSSQPEDAHRASVVEKAASLLEQTSTPAAPPVHSSPFDKSPRPISPFDKPAQPQPSPANRLSEGSAFSPVTATPATDGASAPEGVAPKPSVGPGPRIVPPLAQPGAKTGPDPSTGIDAHLPPIDSYELDALNVQDGDTEPPPPPDREAQATAEPSSEASTLQAAAVEALFATGSQNSAAEQLEETTWTVTRGEVQIQTSLSKPLMNTIFRADTQAIIRGAIANKGGAGLKLVFLPGTVANKATAAPKKPRTGSAQAKALEHPTVQAAQRLFNAEITNVFDLRKD